MEKNKEFLIEEMKKIRSKSRTLRFLMATSFASPLVEILNINLFIVHLWGKSETGKTLAEMVCASIWGNPAKGFLLTTLDNTQVAFERQCNFLRNIPLIVDELQIIKTKYDNFDTLVYALTEGKGRDRGTIDGGLMEGTVWNNISILSGEEPITTSSSKEGVKNRVIEVEENTSMFENGRETASLIYENYGFAGKQFISMILNRDSLFDEYNNIVKK